MGSYFILKLDLDSDISQYIEVFNSFSLDLCKEYLIKLKSKYPKNLYILVHGYGYCVNGKIYFIDDIDVEV